MSNVSQGMTGDYVSVVDDGTNYDIQVLGTTVLSVRKSDKQLLVSAGVSTDQSL